MTVRTQWMYYLTVFLTGAAVLIIEIAATRILAPYYGSSTFVFSGILTVILAALSGGYYLGGVLADRIPHFGPLYMLISLSGLMVLSSMVYDNVLFAFAQEVLSMHTGPLVLSLLLFFLPALLLGMVSPYMVKLVSREAPSSSFGRITGLIFCWGTVGSIVGSLAGGFYFVPVLGVTLSILLVGGTLVVLGIVGSLVLEYMTHHGFGQVSPRMWMFYGILLVVMMVLVMMRSGTSLVTDRTILHESEGLYSHIVVYEDMLRGQPVRTLKRDINNSSASFVHSDELVFGYSKFAMLYPLLHPNVERFLVIGGGAYSIPRSLLASTTDLHVDVIEIEPVLHDLAKQYFGLPETERLTNYAMDGRVFFNAHKHTYDVIFEDAFSDGESVPVHLATHEFYTQVYDALSEQGVLMINYIGTLTGTETPTLTGSLLKTVQSVFPNVQVYAFAAERPQQKQNIVLVAQKGVAAPALPQDTVIRDTYDNVHVLADMYVPATTFALTEEMVFTDDRAPLEYLWLKQ